MHKPVQGTSGRCLKETRLRKQLFFTQGGDPLGHRSATWDGHSAPTRLCCPAGPALATCIPGWSPCPAPTHSLTRPWEDVDHALGNAGLQGQLCELQGCEWCHLKGQERWLGEVGSMRPAHPPWSAVLTATNHKGAPAQNASTCSSRWE